MKALVLFLVLGGTLGPGLPAQDLTFLTHELKPFTWKDGAAGNLEGIVFDLCRETITRMGYASPKFEVLPFERALLTVQTRNNYAMFHVARTPDREPTLKWVGPIIENGVYFYASKDLKTVPGTLEGFKALGRIGVGKGNATEAYLKTAGFTNLYSLPNEMEAVRLLGSGSVDAVAVGELVINELARDAQVDPGTFVQTRVKVLESSLYMGFSRNISDGEIARWQAVLDQVLRDKYEALYQRYIGRQVP